MYKGMKRTFSSNNHIVGIKVEHLTISDLRYSMAGKGNIPAAIPTPIPILAP